MATWNHRVTKQVLKDALGDDCTWYEIRECFYDSKKDVDPHSWTEDSIKPGGETIEDLRIELERMLKALDKPVIEINEDLERVNEP